MVVATPVIPDSTGPQTGTEYKVNIDADGKVDSRLAWAFAPHEQSTPDMTVRLEAGFIPKIGATATEVAAQSTAVLTAPSVNPRNDIVHVDAGTGAVAVATGAENASPVDPSVPAGKIAVARIRFATSTTTITNSILDDLRNFGADFSITDLTALAAPATGDEMTVEDVSAAAKRKMTLANMLKVLNALTEDTVPDTAADFLLAYDVSAAAAKKVKMENVGGFPSGTVMLFHQAAAPTGWTRDTAATLNQSALRLVTSSAWGSGRTGATGFTTIFGSGKTTGSHTVTTGEMPSHTHGLQQGDSAGTGSQTTATKASGLTSGAAGGGGGHTHTLSLDLQYVDMIIATKD